jgi:hypothetical protein
MMNSILPRFSDESHLRGQNRLRLFAKRPTQIATVEDQAFPLHIQNPPVPFLSWSIADELIKIGANDGDEVVWFSTTPAYRDEAAAIKLFSDRNASFDHPSSAALFGDDLKILLDSKFAMNTGMTIEQFKKKFSSRVLFVKLFAAVEVRNDVTRRRIIGWPRGMNEAERKVIKELKNHRHARVMFASASEVRDRGVKFRHAASLDFKKFYQQFELLVKQFFAFVVGNIVHILATIPTGAASPPLFANALSRTLLAISVRAGGVQDRVEFDCCIDNLRFCSDDLNALWIAWHELIAICAKLGATIGDQQPPPLATPNPYTYLGMLFSTVDGVSRVELAEKSRRKLISAASMLKSESEMLVVDVIAIFGQTVWACTVTGSPLGRFYHVLKFIRRIGNRPMNSLTTIWKSIIELWSNELIAMTTMTFSSSRIPTTTATMYTDASEAGWGVVILDFLDRPIRIFGNQWSNLEAQESINMLELRALRIGLRTLATIKSSDDVIALTAFIDNTTARAWTLRRRAPKYSANQLALEIDDILKQSKIQLVHLDYVESARNLADKPSRIFSAPRGPTPSQLRPADGHEEREMERHAALQRYF